METKMIEIPFRLHIACLIQRGTIHGVLETEYGEKVTIILESIKEDVYEYEYENKDGSKSRIDANYKERFWLSPPHVIIKVPDIKKAKVGDFLVYGSSSICRVVRPFGAGNFIVGECLGRDGNIQKKIFEYHEIEGFATDSMIEHTKEKYIKAIDVFFKSK